MYKKNHLFLLLAFNNSQFPIIEHNVYLSELHLDGNNIKMAWNGVKLNHKRSNILKFSLKHPQSSPLSTRQPNLKHNSSATPPTNTYSLLSVYFKMVISDMTEVQHDHYIHQKLPFHSYHFPIILFSFCCSLFPILVLSPFIFTLTLLPTRPAILHTPPQPIFISHLEWKVSCSVCSYLFLFVAYR